MPTKLLTLNLAESDGSINHELRELAIQQHPELLQGRDFYVMPQLVVMLQVSLTMREEVQEVIEIHFDADVLSALTDKQLDALAEHAAANKLDLPDMNSDEVEDFINSVVGEDWVETAREKGR